MPILGYSRHLSHTHCPLMCAVFTVLIIPKIVLFRNAFVTKRRFSGTNQHEFFLPRYFFHFGVVFRHEIVCFSPFPLFLQTPFLRKGQAPSLRLEWDWDNWFSNAKKAASHNGLPVATIITYGLIRVSVTAIFIDCFVKEFRDTTARLFRHHCCFWQTEYPKY